MQGDRWEIGVEAKLGDPHFDIHDRVVRLASDYTGGTTLSLDTNVELSPYILQDGNDIWVGPSTDFDYARTVMKGEVTAVASNVVTISADLGSDFKAGDPVTIRTGSRAWTLMHTMTHTDRIYSITDGGCPVSGFTSAMRVQGDHASDWGPYHYQFNQNTAVNSIVSGCTKYRLSFLYKNLGAFRFFVKFCNGAGDAVENAYDVLVSSNHTIWTFYSYPFTLYRDDCNRFSIGFYLTGANVPHDLIVDSVTVEHVHGTSGASTGFLEFSTLADANTIRFKNRVKGQRKALVSGGIREVNVAAHDKFALGGRFTHVDDVLYKDLAILKTWQNRHNRLVIHSSLDYVPNVMVGYMDLSEEGIRIWDYERPSYNFEFTEA